MDSTTAVARSSIGPTAASLARPSLKQRSLDALLSAVAAVVGLAGTLFFLEVGPEVFGTPGLFTALGVVWVLSAMVFAACASGVWQERAVLAATLALGTTASLVLPETVGLGVLALATAVLVLILRSVARVVATVVSVAFVAALVAAIAPSMVLSVLLVGVLLPLGLLLATSPPGRRRNPALAVVAVCALVLVAAVLDAMGGNLEPLALLLAPVAAAAALWYSARPAPA